MACRRQPFEPAEMSEEEAHKFQRGTSIGSGVYGELFVIMLRSNLYAVKIMRPSQAGEDRKQWIEFAENEIKLLQKINHPNVVSICDAFVTPQMDFYIVMPYIQGDTLESYCQSFGGAGNEGSHRYLDRLQAEGYSGLEAIHAAGVAHRDVKGDNLLVTRKRDDDPHLIIIDLGNGCDVAICHGMERLEAAQERDRSRMRYVFSVCWDNAARWLEADLYPD
jgi:calcium-dependent protein kinase